MTPRERVVFYPLLAAAYPVLALAAKNVEELSGWAELVEPLTMALAVAAAAWLIATRLTWDRHKRALLTGAVVAFFALYVPVEGAVEIWLGMIAPALVDSAPPVAVALGLCMVAAFGFLIRRSRRDLRALSRYLNATAVILVLFPTATLLRAALNPPPTLSVRLAAPAATAASRRPDIYLIVLDEYTGSRSLAANYQFDNRAFENALRERGFTVPRASRSNYVWTFLTLASMLNWRYLDDIPAQVGAESHDPRLAFSLIRDNRTWEFLEPLGYRFVFFPTAYPFTASTPHAHVHLPDPRHVTKEFQGVWRQSTPLASVAKWGCRLIECERDLFPFTPETVELINWKFEQLGSLPNTEAPLFVFAHLAVPHEPYVFHADCRSRPAFWPSFEGGAPADQVKAAYVEQITCVNRKLEELVDRLLARDRDHPPIIILQSDHGYAFMGRKVPPLAEVGPAQIDERTDIFAAYYLPDGDGGIIHDAITPVNVFRVIFSRYFGADLSLLEDRTYWSGFPGYFRFTRVY